MQFINALSLAPSVNDWLANSYHPRVLHVFDHVCNLINEYKEVLSVVTPQIGNGPFNLVIENDVLFSKHLNLQSPISHSTNQFNLEDLLINTADAKLWFPRPNWERLHGKRDDILIQIMSLRGRWSHARSNLLANLKIASSQRAGTLLATTLPITNYQVCGLDMPFANIAQDYSTTDSLQSPISNSLISSLASADFTSSLTAAKQLAGLGIGMTPSGDDFIMGALYAEWIIHPPEIARVFAEEIATTSAPLTTSLSAAWLRSAGKGEAGILWHRFFDALVSGDEADIQLQITKLLSVGHTSGADSLAGFMDLFTCWGEHCSNLWEYNQP